MVCASRVGAVVEGSRLMLPGCGFASMRMAPARRWRMEGVDASTSSERPRMEVMRRALWWMR